MYQSKDSTIQIGCQFLQLNHSDETFNVLKARSQIVPREHMNLRKISYAKMQSLVQSVKKSKTLLFKLNMTISYSEDNSVISIKINNLENVGNFKKPKVEQTLKLKLKKQERNQNDSIKIKLKSIRNDNDLSIDKNVDFKLNKLHFQKSEIIVRNG